MTAEIESALAGLTAIQRRAADWQDGPLLVLAGPGSGKTRVLTTRIARILAESASESFRVLALTFTNKAADEMISRVNVLVPGLSENRAFIGTFHAFCSQVLRQHGSHIGIQSGFTIYSMDEDRRQLLREALARGRKSVGGAVDERADYLPVIDRLKSRLIAPSDAARAFADPQQGAHFSRVFELYEEELRRNNALDFNSLLVEVHRLIMEFPAIAARYRRSYRFWLVDEFQDTNRAQYRLLSTLAGQDFRNVFAVADDDQIIYEWNGASFKQIQQFVRDFAPELVQLPTNYRCPRAIVDAANKLVSHNVTRTASKQPLVAGRTEWRLPEDEHIRLLSFADQDQEASGIAADIAARPKQDLASCSVLARGRWLLDRVHSELTANGVSSAVVQRRDDFQSPEFRWLHACLKQLLRPLDKRNFVALVGNFNRLLDLDLQSDLLMSEAEASGRSYLNEWMLRVEKAHGEEVSDALPHLSALIKQPDKYGAFVTAMTEWFQRGQGDGIAPISSDLQEDSAAWQQLSREIAHAVGPNSPLDQFLQELDLRSKEPEPERGAVRLMTIHAAKGTEFDFVYLMGMAEEVIPSFQSLRPGSSSAELEEERRNCFVAITRTRECLTLSWAARYRGYLKRPSRFIAEMGLG